jgi:acylphosphatase
MMISGKVQGVFFRKNVKEQADKLGLKGWVRNVEDKVEVVAQGEKVADLMDYCLKGPEAAKVTNLDYTDEECEEFDGFDIRYK